jgi:nitrite reductase/ring-hydroxylating ferredoxin subunit
MKALHICNLSSIQDGSFVKYIDEIKDEIIVFKFNNDILIRSSICPHFGGELFFDKDKSTLRCNWHAWEFEPQKGKCLTYDVKSNVRSYEITTLPTDQKKHVFFIENSEIFLKL